jgi:hypothetical protein
MRLALLALALALALPAASGTAAPAAPKAGHAAAPGRICAQDMSVRDARSPQSGRLKLLGELPPGNLTLTVVNRVGDCIEPIVVRQGIGAAQR